MLKHLGQQKAMPKIMLSGGVCNTSYVPDHDCREIDLLASIHEHDIRLIAPLAPRNDVLDNEPEQELIEWCHITLLHCLGGV